MGEIRKLPLWKGLYEKLIEEGIDYGKTYPADKFEKELSCNRESREFGIEVHKIRVELEKLGYYLQGKVESAGILVIVPAEKNVKISIKSEKRIRKNRLRSAMLLQATDLKRLPKKIKDLHLKTQERIEIKMLLEKRAARISKYLKEKAPKMLEGT